MKKILFLLPVLMLLFGSAFAQKQPHDLSIERGLDKSKPWLMLSDTVDSKYRYGKFKCYDWDSTRTAISIEIDDDVSVAMNAIDALPIIESGTYTPSVYFAANLDSNPTITFAKYSRIGSIVTVSMTFRIDPTTANTLTSFYVTIPIYSDFTNGDECSGSFNYINSNGSGSGITLLHTDLETVQFSWVCNANVTANQHATAIFQYLIQ